MAYKIKSVKKKIEPKSIWKKYWTIERDEKGNYKFSLGNLTDAGWYWDGKTDEAIGFLRRIDKSEIKDQFLIESKKEGITFESLKPALFKSAKVSYGFYMLSGDNRVWRFGEDGEPEQFVIEEESEKIKNKFYTEFEGVDYDTFERQNKAWYKTEIEKAIRSSKDYKTFFEKSDNIAEELRERYENAVIEKASKTLLKIKRGK